MQHQIVTLYTTLPDADIASKISFVLVEQGLIACSNAWPIQSTYLWEGSVAKEGEIGLMMKLFPLNLPQVLIYLQENHPYRIPLINYWLSEVNELYYKWMEKESESNPGNIV